MPFTTINNHRIHYLEASDLGYSVDTKLPIVLVHGLGSSENYYVPILEQLSGHRVVIPSTYGAGQSKSQGEKLTLEDLADDVIGLMNHLKIEKAVIGGHSMGGPLVLTVAARNADRVAGVVGIGPVSLLSLMPSNTETYLPILSIGQSCLDQARTLHRSHRDSHERYAVHPRVREIQRGLT